MVRKESLSEEIKLLRAIAELENVPDFCLYFLVHMLMAILHQIKNGVPKVLVQEDLNLMAGFLCFQKLRHNLLQI